MRSLRILMTLMYVQSSLLATQTPLFLETNHLKTPPSFFMAEALTLNPLLSKSYVLQKTDGLYRNLQRLGTTVRNQMILTQHAMEISHHAAVMSFVIGSLLYGTGWLLHGNVAMGTLCLASIGIGGQVLAVPFLKGVQALLPKDDLPELDRKYRVKEIQERELQATDEEWHLLLSPKEIIQRADALFESVDSIHDVFDRKRSARIKRSMRTLRDHAKGSEWVDARLLIPHWNQLMRSLHQIEEFQSEAQKRFQFEEVDHSKAIQLIQELDEMVHTFQTAFLEFQKLELSLRKSKDLPLIDAYSDLKNELGWLTHFYENRILFAKGIPTRETFSLSEMLEYLQATYSAQAHPITWTQSNTQLPDMTLQGDKFALQYGLQGLIDHALKNPDLKGKKLSITIKVENDSVYLDIIDLGFSFKEGYGVRVESIEGRRRAAFLDYDPQTRHPNLYEQQRKQISSALWLAAQAAGGSFQIDKGRSQGGNQRGTLFTLRLPTSDTLQVMEPLVANAPSAELQEALVRMRDKHGDLVAEWVERAPILEKTKLFLIQKLLSPQLRRAWNLKEVQGLFSIWIDPRIPDIALDYIDTIFYEQNASEHIARIGEMDIQYNRGLLQELAALKWMFDHGLTGFDRQTLTLLSLGQTFLHQEKKTNFVEWDGILTGLNETTQGPELIFVETKSYENNQDSPLFLDPKSPSLKTAVDFWTKGMQRLIEERIKKIRSLQKWQSPIDGPQGTSLPIQGPVHVVLAMRDTFANHIFKDAAQTALQHVVEKLNADYRSDAKISPLPLVQVQVVYFESPLLAEENSNGMAVRRPERPFHMEPKDLLKPSDVVLVDSIQRQLRLLAFQIQEKAYVQTTRTLQKRLEQTNPESLSYPQADLLSRAIWLASDYQTADVDEAIRRIRLQHGTNYSVHDLQRIIQQVQRDRHVNDWVWALRLQLFGTESLPKMSHTPLRDRIQRRVFRQTVSPQITLPIRPQLKMMVSLWIISLTNVGWILKLLEGLLEPTGNILSENTMIAPIVVALTWGMQHMWSQARNRSLQMIAHAA